MKVLKFGGTSVKNAENILKVKEILVNQYNGKGDYAVVVSAMSGVTDELIQMSKLASKGDIAYQVNLEKLKDRHFETAKSLLNKSDLKKIENELSLFHETLGNVLKGVFLVMEASNRSLDYILSFGERNSAFIIAAAFKQRGLKAKYLDARSIIVTDKKFGNAKVDFKTTDKKIQGYFKENKGIVPIITGFIAADKGGLTTTLGRGGSDYTAAIIAGALKADQLDIWTDVDGLLTSNPKLVKKAFTVPYLSYKEAMELSHFGAKVIYPPTIQPALQKHIPIKILNTFNPTFEGTRIGNESKQQSDKPITGLSSFSGVVLLTLQGPGLVGIPGIAARLFKALAEKEINIILISQGSSEYSICFAVKEGEQYKAKQAIKSEFEKEIKEKNVAEVLIEPQMSIVAIVSEKMKNHPGVAGKLFSTLGREGINVVAIAQGSSELNISFVIDTKDEEKALNLIHDSFFLSEYVDVNVFMIGVGLIGGTLINQINSHSDSLKSTHKINIKLIGLANTKNMLITQDGISTTAWKETLNESIEVSDLNSFVSQMIDIDLPNSVFIDNTANSEIPKLYNQILSNNISIVTPNKIATSSKYENYLKLKSTAAKKKVSFLYETNVGAGLPVISTIENLVLSGDRITKLEAVLSGSVSYIFNTFSAKRKFSDVVFEAKNMGLTEPDPREDLSGEDVRRKITILAREAGYKVEMNDVKLKGILNKACLNAKSVADFMTELAAMDNHFEKLAGKANEENGKLRFIATMENGKCSIGLKTVDSESPFFNLGGSDNMLVITTERYNIRPLVIKGPGAGADVTAAGVFAEIVSIGNKYRG